MKTKEELNALKNEVEAMNKKLAKLNEDELKLVVGGAEPGEYTNFYDKIRENPDGRIVFVM